MAVVAVADGQFFWGRALLAGSAPSQSSIFGAGAIFVTDHHMSGETFRPYGARDGCRMCQMGSWSHGVMESYKKRGVQINETHEIRNA